MIPKRSHSLNDAEKNMEGADHRAEVLAGEYETKTKATFKDKGYEDRWFLVNANSALAEVVLPIPTAIYKARLVDHIKQEGQKAYDVKVPTHLWSFFFRESFLHYFGLVSGRTVEWHQRHPNVYRRHNWKYRTWFPKG